jgi:DNA-binding CsgD family transcriptional regulator
MEMADGPKIKTSVWIRSERVWQLFRLLHEAAEISRDLPARRELLVTGMTRLVGAPLGGLATDVDFGPGRRGQMVEFALSGFDPSTAPVFGSLLERGTSYNPALKALMESPELGGSAPVGGRREQMVPERIWYRSEYTDTFMAGLGLDAALYAAVSFGPRTVFGSGLIRTRRERPFSDEDVELYRLFAAEAARLWQPPPAPLGAKLPPRLHRLLEMYLLGLSEKEAADRLGLTFESVHTYTRELYRKLGVGSRAQLLALALRSRD